MTARAKIALARARRLFLAGQGMLDDPSRRQRSTAAHALDTIRRLGFVQLDSIHVVERAHHHILWARDHAYAPRHLEALQRSGKVFEHFTHDASILPAEVYPQWKHAFARASGSSWFGARLGSDGERVMQRVRDRIEREGPLLARDFERAGKAGGWWEWTPEKAALEMLWRRGVLAVPRRERFEKVYDLAARVIPEHHARASVSVEEHVDWACKGALSRLGVASPSELARFWKTVSIAEARSWCERSADAEAVELEGHGPAWARADWREALADAGALPEEPRLLSPFDPIVRDRARLERLFGFGYRFEAFVPAPKRTHGYYVLPLLAGEKFVGRVDAALNRKTSTLQVNGVWWEAPLRGKGAERRRSALLEAALSRYAAFVGADDWSFGRSPG